MIYEPGTVSETIEKHEIHVSALQYMPFGLKKYRYYLPVLPLLFKSFCLKKYDLIISVSHCVAKNAKPGRNGIHICYCNSPMRYIWDMFDDYFSPEKSVPVYVLMKAVRPVLRYIDRITAGNVTWFIGNSNTIKDRIKTSYQRAADVIYPPVNINYYTPLYEGNKRNGTYLVVSSLVPYKRIELAVRAFNETGRPLKIIGSGPELGYLKRIAGANIEFQGWGEKDELRENYRKCRALIFPGKEDFGIVPVEAMACGMPVIAYGEGGATETVIEGVTGIYFPDKTAESLNAAIEKFEKLEWEPGKIRNRAEAFSEKIFIESFSKYVSEKTAGIQP